MWLLIVMMFGVGGFMDHVEFSSEQSCKSAIEEIYRSTRYRDFVMNCTKK